MSSHGVLDTFPSDGNGVGKRREFYEAEQKKIRDTAEALRTAEKKGEKNKAVTMAKKSLEEGLSIELISKLTGLSEENI